MMTSSKQAVRLIAAGRARYIDERTIEILAVAIPDPGEERSTARQSPTPMRVIDEVPDSFLGQTYLHYPQAA
jgi:hypothetical protein